MEGWLQRWRLGCMYAPRSSRFTSSSLYCTKLPVLGLYQTGSDLAVRACGLSVSP